MVNSDVGCWEKTSGIYPPAGYLSSIKLRVKLAFIIEIFSKLVFPA